MNIVPGTSWHLSPASQRAIVSPLLLSFVQSGTEEKSRRCAPCNRVRSGLACPGDRGRWALVEIFQSRLSQAFVAAAVCAPNRPARIRAFVAISVADRLG